MRDMVDLVKKNSLADNQGNPTLLGTTVKSYHHRHSGNNLNNEYCQHWLTGYRAHAGNGLISRIIPLLSVCCPHPLTHTWWCNVYLPWNNPSLHVFLLYTDWCRNLIMHFASAITIHKQQCDCIGKYIHNTPWPMISLLALMFTLLMQMQEYW